ncbi:spore germination protein [Caldalkalibacillus salinus]|uniref:spore germination protein n=1 Tax=Caldalkalibacillus salinus TaxID=2803787 RepID=UPI0019246DA4|nr:spore germination protein [Caldalkalibacillus salinus]
MLFKNKIANVDIDNVSSNGSINFGHSILKGITAGSQTVGGQSTIGDDDPSLNVNHNHVKDPDGVDQGQKQF